MSHWTFSITIISDLMGVGAISPSLVFLPEMHADLVVGHGLFLGVADADVQAARRALSPR